MGGRGSRSMTQTQTPRATSRLPDWREAFAPGTDYERTGDVDHNQRTVTKALQDQWDKFTAPFEAGVTDAERDIMGQSIDRATGAVYGYFRTTNSMEINKALNDPANSGKTIEQIFTRTDNAGRKRDLETVKTLDKAIAKHVTQRDATYTRYCHPQTVGRAFGLSQAQLAMLIHADDLSSGQLETLKKAMVGKTSMTKGYTSTSANKSMNAFSNPYAVRSRGYIFERKLYLPKGTHAYATKRNAQESEVLLGRNLRTKIIGISVNGVGHIVIHEMYDGNR